MPEGSRPKRRIGTRMPDGTIYAGISPDTGGEMFAMPSDMPLTHAFNDLRKTAAAVEAHGRHDWRPPSKAELNVLFNNAAAIGGFDMAGWYWSSTRASPFVAWSQRFSDGQQECGDVNNRRLLRCVR